MGGKSRKTRYYYSLKNFAIDLDKYLWTNYVYINGGKKCFFQSNDYWEYLKNPYQNLRKQP